MSINDGGPAFPVAADEYTKGFYGMSLRDYFAAAALQGLFSIEANPRVGVDMEPYTTRHNPMMAAHAYALADAMLAAREPQFRQAPSDPADIAANKTAEGT